MIFIITFYLFVISFCISMNRVIYTPLVTFSTINNISISVERSNFTLAFLKAACHANLGAVRNREMSRSHIPRHISRRFSNISANNNISLWTCKSWCSPNFLCQNLCKSFLCACNPHQHYLPCLSDCKNLLLQVMMFYWIFTNYWYIHAGKHLFTTIK